MQRSDRERLATEVSPPGSKQSEDWNPEAIDHDERLILWMLEMTPTKRLEILQDFVDAVLTLRNGRKVTQ